MITRTARTLALGDRAPAFVDLPAANGGRYSLASFAEAGQLALIFLGNGCPSVKAYREELNRIQLVYRDRGAQLVAVNSNNEFLSPPDGLAGMQELSRGWTFPYLKDTGGELARRCGAIVTLHALLFDAQRRLRYRGRVSDSRRPSSATQTDLVNAIEDLQAGREVAVPETKPTGCSIVW